MKRGRDGTKLVVWDLTGEDEDQAEPNFTQVVHRASEICGCDFKHMFDFDLGTYSKCQPTVADTVSVRLAPQSKAERIYFAPEEEEKRLLRCVGPAIRVACIFAYFTLSDLLAYRLVCKQENELVLSARNLWPQPAYTPREWISLQRAMGIHHLRNTIDQTQLMLNESVSRVALSDLRSAYWDATVGWRANAVRCIRRELKKMQAARDRLVDVYGATPYESRFMALSYQQTVVDEEEEEEEENSSTDEV